MGDFQVESSVYARALFAVPHLFSFVFDFAVVILGHYGILIATTSILLYH